MNQTQERLQDIEKKGYQIDFANVFNHAFENYKKIAIYAGLVLFVFSILFVVFIIVSLVSVLGPAEMAKEFSPETFKLENLSPSDFIKLNAASLTLSWLLSPFQAAFLKMAHCADRDEAFHISDLFAYYKFSYLKEILLATFLIAFITFAQMTLFSLVHLEFLGNLVTYFINFVTLLTIPLIIFGKLQAIESLKYSLLIISKNPLVILGLMIVAIIASFVGIMACCIGILFTIPFLYSMNYAVYDAIVGIDTDEILSSPKF